MNFSLLNIYSIFNRYLLDISNYMASENIYLIFFIVFIFEKNIVSTKTKQDVVNKI